jgi:hypothetical protein
MVKGMVTSKLKLHNISDVYLAGIYRNILLSMVNSNSSQISLQISKTEKKNYGQILIEIIFECASKNTGGL